MPDLVRCRTATISRADVEAAMRDIQQLVREHTGGRIVFSTVLAADQPTVHFPIP